MVLLLSRVCEAIPRRGLICVRNAARDQGSRQSGSLHRFQISKNRFLHGFLSSFCVFIPHRPTKLLIELAACKSLKILEVASRALASLLITERGICGNRSGNRAVAGTTLATPKGVFNGGTGKKIPTDMGWDFEYWWWNTEPNLRPLSEADSNRTRKCPCFRANVLFPSRALSTKGRRGLGWRARKQSPSRTRVRFRLSQLNRRPH